MTLIAEFHSDCFFWIRFFLFLFGDVVHDLQAWAGPLCPANNDPVRAFYVEPMGEELLQNVQNPIAENAMGSSAEAVDVISSKIAVVRPYVDEVDYKSVQLSDDDGIVCEVGPFEVVRTYSTCTYYRYTYCTYVTY